MWQFVNMLGHTAMSWHFRMSQWQLLNHQGVSLLLPSPLFSEIPVTRTGVARWQMWVGCNITSFWSHSPNNKTGLQAEAKMERSEQASQHSISSTLGFHGAHSHVSSVTPSRVHSYFQPRAPLFSPLRLVLVAVPAIYPQYSTPQINDLEWKFKKET